LLLVEIARWLAEGIFLVLLGEYCLFTKAFLLGEACILGETCILGEACILGEGLVVLGLGGC
jgi:hypothetical protein